MSTDTVLRHGNRKSVRDVPEKAKIAIEHLLTTPGADLESAANAADLPTHMLRRYLHRPEVRKYLYEQRQIHIDAIAANNPESLRQIIATSPNQMAKVQAIRTVELLRTENEQSAGIGSPHRPQAAGITIILEAGPGAAAKVIGAPTIDVTPDPDCDPHHWPSVR